MPVKTVPFFDKYAAHASAADTAVYVTQKNRRRAWGERKEQDHAFARVIDGKEILNVVESNQILPVRDWYELITAPPADRKATKYMLVDKGWKIKIMLDTLTSRPPDGTVGIFLDLEGQNLGFELGTTDLISIFHSPTRHAFLVHLPVLGAKTAFDTPSTEGTSLKSLLENGQYAKGIWDVRNDAAGLFRNFGVQLHGVVDLQLLTCKVQTHNDRRIDLDTAIGFRCGLDDKQRITWRNTKIQGKVLWKPNFGGDFAVFQQYPLNEIVISYCVGDIAFLPELYESLVTDLTVEDMNTVRLESRKTAALSRKEYYNPGFSWEKVRNPFYVEVPDRVRYPGLIG